MGNQKMPHGWVTIKLHELMAKTQSVNPTKSDKNLYELWSVPAFPSDTPEYLHGAEIGSNKQLVEPGDILLCKINPRINRVWLVREKGEIEQIASTEWIVLRSEKLYPKFIMYQLREEEFRKRLCADLSGVGGSLTRARPKIAGKLEIKIAPINEQKRIVTKIEELQSHSRRAKEALETIPDLLEQLRQSILVSAFRGDLTKKWREQHKGQIEPATELLKRIRIERRKRWEGAELDKLKAKGFTGDKIDVQFAKRRKQYREPGPVDTTELPELPKGWCWSKVSIVGDVQLGRQRSPKYHSGKYMRPYLRVQNIFENRIDLSDVMEMNFPPNDFAKYRLDSGDILLNEGQSLELVGRPAIYRGELPGVCFTNTLIRFQAHPGILPEFALFLFIFYMHAGRFTKIATISTNIAHLGAGRFSEIEFPVPSLEEQRQIVRLLGKMEHHILILKKESNNISKNLNSLDASTLSKAFQGKLVSQDPNDESASILFERIQQVHPKTKGGKRNRKLIAKGK